MNNPKGLHVSTTEIPIRFYDMDAFGHVNNSVYFTFFELARINWWREVSPPDTNFLDTGPVIINAYCTFHKSIHFPETVSVKMYVGPPGRSSYECCYEIYSSTNPDVLYAEGNTKVVWVDRKLEKSIPLPDYIIKHLPTKTSL